MKQIAFLFSMLFTLNASADECPISDLTNKIKKEITQIIRTETGAKGIPFDESTLTFNTAGGFQAFFKVGNTTVSLRSTETQSTDLVISEYEHITDLRDSMGDIYGRLCSHNVDTSFVLHNERNGATISDYLEMWIHEDRELGPR